MKKTRKCPKCGGQTIFYVRGDETEGRHFIIRTGLFTSPTIGVDRYICTTCSFTEEYISNEGMAVIRNAIENGKLN